MCSEVMLTTWSSTSKLLILLFENVEVQCKLWLQLTGLFVNDVNSSQNLPVQHSAVHDVTGIVCSADMAVSRPDTETYLKANDLSRVDVPAALHSSRKPKPV